MSDNPKEGLTNTSSRDIIESKDGWIDLRLPSGKCVGKYHPQTKQLQVKVRGESKTFDLGESNSKK